jgi:hypothetical protein
MGQLCRTFSIKERVIEWLIFAFEVIIYTDVTHVIRRRNLPHDIIKHKIDVAMRKRDALEFRARGMTYREVHQALIMKYGKDALPDSYDERNCYADVQDELSKITLVNPESAKMMRMLMAERLDKMMLVIFNEALGGNLKAVDRVLKIEDFRARLFGLYEPSRVKVDDWRSEIIDLLKQGKITISQVEDEFGAEVAKELVESRGTSVVDGTYTEEKSNK